MYVTLKPMLGFSQALHSVWVWIEASIFGLCIKNIDSSKNSNLMPCASFIMYCRLQNNSGKPKWTGSADGLLNSYLSEITGRHCSLTAHSFLHPCISNIHQHKHSHREHLSFFKNWHVSHCRYKCGLMCNKRKSCIITSN